VQELFKENRLAKGTFVALDKRLDLKVRQEEDVIDPHTEHPAVCWLAITQQSEVNSA
jgi:hypothetical protein